MDLGFALAGAAVGFLVGMTGVGGGSLMAPLLILLFGFNPSVAVGTDLWFASVTKIFGGVVHQRVGRPNWEIVRRLALGSLPAAIVTLAWLGFSHQGKLNSDLTVKIIAVALFATAIITPIKGYLKTPFMALRNRMGAGLRRKQFIATVVCGIIVGVLVTLTSIGAGALVAAMLLLVYPLRMNAKAVVSTDIMHAIPLALVAALGHSFLGNVDWMLLGQLLLGSIPGIIVGSLLASRINDKVMAMILSVMLLVTSFKLWTA